MKRWSRRQFLKGFTIGSFTLLSGVSLLNSQSFARSSVIQMTQVTGGPGEKWYPQLSVDEQIVYTKRHQGLSRIWKIHLNGTGDQELTTADQLDSRPSWYPDGSRIVYLRDIRVPTSERINYLGDEIWEIHENGTDPRRLLSIEIFSDENFDAFLDPQWDPSGRYLLFSAGRIESLDFSLLLLDTETQRIIGLPDKGGNARWTPSGKILFDDEEPDGISLIELDFQAGTRAKIQIFEGAEYILPCSNATEKKLAYIYRGDQWELRIADMDGSNSRTIVQGDPVVGWPNWHPIREDLLVFTKGTRAYGGEIFKIEGV